MFTGIIAEQGKVLSVERNGDISATVRLHAPGTTEGLALGGSIAVNGVCLTATEIDGKDFSVDVMGETLIRSTIGELAAGDPVNLERCVQAGGRLDGHVVQGHVDGVGELLEREGLGNWDRLRFGVPAGLARYIAEKGSIAVDGVSLTVTAVSPAPEPAPWFEVGLIPTTLAETGLGAKGHGSRVNLEVDVLAKYTERLLAFSSAAAGGAARGEVAAQ
jgi:riboflavin synthase